MTSSRSRLSSVLGYTAAFAIPIALVMASLWRLGMYPFGNYTISSWDLQVTYTYFYDWFRHCLQNGSSVFYSFGKSLGGNMYATFTDFCLSPTAWLFGLYQGQNPIDFVTYFVVTKFGLAGVAAFFYMRHRFGLDHLPSLLLSICYAMMLFMTSQAVNPMWLDVVIVLPLVMYGIYRLVRQGKCVLFFVSLLICILTSFYMGYMVCLFSMMFYLFEGFLAAPQSKHRRGHCCCYLARFCITFTLAVVASAVVLYPTAIGLLAGKGAVPGGLFTFEFRYDLNDIFRSFLLGVYEKESLPQLYTGTLVIVCAIWYFLSKGIQKREKIAMAILFGIMVFSTWYAPFDRIWMGFRDGHSFYCRFAFLLSALLVFMAARVLSLWFSKKDTAVSLEATDGCRAVSSSAADGDRAASSPAAGADSKKRGAKAIFSTEYRLLWVAAGIVALVAAIAACDGNMRIRYALITVFLCITLPLGIIFWRRWGKSGKRYLVGACLLLAVSCEMGISCYTLFGWRLASDNVCTYDRYQQYFSEAYAQKAELESEDGTDCDAYRVDKTYNFLSPFRRIASNEGLVLGYSHVEQYDSAYDDAVQNILSYLGYTANKGIVTMYDDSVLPADSLLGIRYVADDKCPTGFVDAGFSVTQDGNRFYENPYALPLGFGASSDVLNTIEFSGDPFEYQNELYSALLGKDVQIYHKVAVEPVTSKEGERSWSVDPSAVSDDAILYENGDVIYSHYLYNWYNWSQGIFPISDTLADGEKTISLTGYIPADAQMTLYVYELDMDAFKDARDTLAAHPFSIDTFEDGYVHGTYTADEDGLLFTTIPADPGWTVKVNGQTVTPQKSQGAFMAIEVQAGQNDIEMTYVSPGFTVGLAVSLLAIAGFVVAVLVMRKRDRKAA